MTDNPLDGSIIADILSPLQTNPLDGSIIADILSPLQTHNSLRVNDRDCFHQGIFPSDITLINNNQSVNPGCNCLTMRVKQCVPSYDACDLHSLHKHISQSCTWKTYGLRIYMYAIMLPTSGFSFVHYSNKFLWNFDYEK